MGWRVGGGQGGLLGRRCRLTGFQGIKLSQEEERCSSQAGA